MPGCPSSQEPLHSKKEGKNCYVGRQAQEMQLMEEQLSNLALPPTEPMNRVQEAVVEMVAASEADVREEVAPLIAMK